MSMISAIIIDDESNIRASLSMKLERYHPDIKVVSSCESTEEAIEKIQQYKPQLLFLDIEMPGQNGLEMLEKLRNQQFKGKVIIVSAYDNIAYLKKALQLTAVDYLIKPFLKEELDCALDRARKAIDEDALLSGIENINLQRQSNLVIEFNSVSGKLFLTPEQIVYINAEGNYSRIFTSDGKNDLVTESLRQLENKLAGTKIIRADRSHFVNKSHIWRIVASSNRCFFQDSSGQKFVQLNETGIKNLLKQ